MATGWGYGAPWETNVFDKFTKKLSAQSNQNMLDRIGIGEFAHGIGKDQRDWANLKIRPIEKSLSEVIRNRLSSGGQDQRIAAAQQGTMDAFDRAGEGATRNAARYGITLDPSADRGFGLDRTKASIMAGNLAGQTDRDAALQDAGRFYQNGAGLPGMATQEYIAGAGSLADQNDYNTGQKLGTGLGQIDAQHEIGMSFADGGAVGGVSAGIGGRPGNTLALRKQYTAYNAEKAGNGEQPLDWNSWLDANGYTLDQDNLVSQKYAAGGVVQELNTGDFIVPVQAMDFYGREFWDKLVADNGGDIQDAEAGETDSAATEASEEGYADGGGVGLGAGIERGYASSLGPVVGAIKTGLTAGLLDARQTEEHDARMADREAARGYMAEDRDYQKTQRARAESEYARNQDLNEATALFMKNGTDFSAINNFNKKYMKNPGNDVSAIPNQDGTYTFGEIGPDGKHVGQPQITSLDKVRVYGMNLLEQYRDPKNYLTNQQNREDKRKALEDTLSEKRQASLDRMSDREAARLDRKENSNRWHRSEEDRSRERDVAQVGQVFGRLLKARTDAGIMEGKPGWKSDDELEQEAINQVRRYRGTDFTRGDPANTTGMTGPGAGQGLTGAEVGPVTRMLPDQGFGIGRPSAAQAAPAQAPAAQSITIPPEAIAHLKKNVGKEVKFKNGQSFMLDANGNLLRREGNKMVPVQ